MDISLMIQRHFLHGAHFISACYSALKYHFIGTFSIYTSDSDSIFCTYKINMSSPIDYRPLTVHQYSPNDNLSGNNCKIQIMILQAGFSGMSNWILTAVFCKSPIHFLQGRIHVTFNSQSSPLVPDQFCYCTQRQFIGEQIYIGEFNIYKFIFIVKLACVMQAFYSPLHLWDVLDQVVG